MTARPTIISFTVLLACCSGCMMTRSLSEYRQEQASFERELRSPLKQTGKSVIEGTYGGLVNEGGHSYHQARFGGVLRGEGRELELMVPREAVTLEPIRARVREASGTARRAPAWLMLLTMTIDENGYEAFSGLEQGQRIELEEFLRDHLGVSAFPQGQQVFLARFVTYKLPEVWLRGVLLERDQKGAWRVSRNLAFSVPADEVELSWEVRSRLLWLASGLLYLFTVPADVLTAPFQYLELMTHAHVF